MQHTVFKSSICFKKISGKNSVNVGAILTNMSMCTVENEKSEINNRRSVVLAKQAKSVKFPAFI
jgi:hypothetical protein